jgi:hypothetical protein
VSTASGPSFHDSWPAPARELVLRAIDRHGGWALWGRLRSVSLSLVSLRGLLPRVKGYRRTFQLPRSATVFPRRGQVVFHDGSIAAPVGHFDPGRRDSFRGWRKLRRWTQPDAFYFFGYALLSYHAVPFVLPELRFLRAVAGRWRGERLQGVRVEHPAGAHVHSRRQNYLFDARGLLRRNDYVADVVGRIAVGAHGWDDIATVRGLPIAARRTVVPRVGDTAIPFPTVLRATFDALSVELEPEPHD